MSKTIPVNTGLEYEYQTYPIKKQYFYFIDIHFIVINVTSDYLDKLNLKQNLSDDSFHLMLNNFVLSFKQD